MQLKRSENKQLYRLVEVALREALWDYSACGDMAVVNINGQPLIFDKSELDALSEIKRQLEKEI